MCLLRVDILSVILLLTPLVYVAGILDISVELRAPRFVVHRHNTTVKCEHNVNHQDLYKVVFYKDGQRIMRYVRERDPPYEFFNVTGAEVNLLKVTPSSITLDKLDFEASGKYTCEVAIEIPLYSKISKIHELLVIVRQKHRPRIKIKHKKFHSNDSLQATCQSAPAYPAPHLSWLINNVKVDEKLTVPYGTINVHRHHNGMPLLMTNSSLHFPIANLQLQPNQTLEITCLSTIPSYTLIGEDFVDVQNHTIFVNVVRLEPPPTQLPVKFTNSEQSAANQNYFSVLIVLSAELLLTNTAEPITPADPLL